MITESTIQAILVVLVSYLMGSIPTAYLIAKSRNINIFEVGSGNMGGTNMVRAMGAQWGILTVIIDGLKGVLAIVIARELIWPQNPWGATSIAAVVAIIGHNWSLFATLLTATIQNGRIKIIVRGGKGAATAFGTMLLIAPFHITVAMVALGGLIVAVTRYVSLGVLVGFGLAIFWSLALVINHQLPSETTFYLVALAALLPIRFKGNIERLIQGTERRLGDSKSS